MSAQLLRSGFFRRHNADALWLLQFFCLTNVDLYTNQIILASAILLVCASAFAETPEALVKQALQRNPELNFFVAEIAAAKGAVRTAGTVRNPELSSEVGYKNSRENSGGASGDGAILALSFSQTFEYPGRIALRKAIANHDRRACRTTSATVPPHIGRACSDAGLWHFERATKAVAAREVASRSQALSDVLEQRPPAGVTPQLEARIIDANMLAFQRQEREAALAIENSFSGAESTLRAICRRTAHNGRSQSAVQCGIASQTSGVLRVQMRSTFASGRSSSLSKASRSPCRRTNDFRP